MNQLFGQPADPDRASSIDLGPSSSSMRPLPVGGAEQAFFHLDVKRSLQLHWRLARNVAIGGVILAICYFLAQAFYYKSWPAYESESMVYVQPTPPRVLETNQGSARWPYDTTTYESYIQQQMMNVSREDVLIAAVKKLDGFKGPNESDQSAALRLVRALNVTREGTSYQFVIAARAGSAQLAADIANAVTEAYMESASRDQKSGDAERLAILRDERDRIQKLMEADRSEQETLNRQLGVASVGTVPDHFDEDITQTRTELVKARTEHDAAQAKFEALGAGHGPTSKAIDAEADALISSDAGLISMKTALYSRRALLVSQMANLTPSHPQYRQDEVELAKINDTLDEMLKDLRTKAAARIQTQLQADLQRTAGVETQMNGQLRQLVGAAGGATSKMQRSSDLAADLTRLQARFASVDEQLHNLLLEDNAPAAAYQITPALVPMGRTKSGVVRNVAIIVVLGLVLGILAAIGVHKLDPKIYIASDVELILGFPPMAQLPDFGEVSEDVAEEYLLRLTSSIEHARKQSNLRNCVFTGTNAGNGVSMLVGRVGQMLEAMGRPTVLVNATSSAAYDRHDRLNAAGPGSGPGLVPVERVSRPTAVLQQIAEETEMQDDSIVLTDTAPLAVSAETEYLVRFVDCAIVVIESGKTRRRELREVAATLQRLDVAAVGFVLNRVGLAKADPAFKQSIRAIEKHLGVRGVKVSERTKTANLKSRPTEAPEVEETFANNPAARSLFGPEVAAAAAAVERVSSPAVSPVSVTAPVTEPVHEFVAEVHHTPDAEVASSIFSHTVIEPATVVRDLPAAAPFLEAARHFSSPLSAGLGMQSPASQVSVPFADVAKHFPSPNFASAETAPAAEASAAAVSALEATHAKQEHEEVLPIEPLTVDRLKAEPVTTELIVASTVAQGLIHDHAPHIEPAVAELAHVELSEDPAHSSQVFAQAPPTTAEMREQPQVELPVLASAASPSIEPANIPVEPEPVSHRAAAPPIDEDWWLSEANRHPEPQRPPVLWKPAKVWLSQDILAQREPLPAGPAPTSNGAQNGLHSADPTSSWNGVERRGAPNANFDAYDSPEGDDTQTNLNSRLSGLRNLLFVMGVKDPHNPEEPAIRYPNIGAPPEVKRNRRAFDRMSEPDPDFAIAGNIGGASPRLVTAPPEFLPPRPVVIVLDKDGGNLGESASRQDRRAAFDGVEILPSKRGQYRKI